MNELPLRIDKEGRWFFQGEEITHRKTYLLYSRSLTRDESDRIIVRIGREQCPVEVEDAPLVVTTLEFVPFGLDGQEAIWLTLNDETREKMDPGTLRIGPSNIPYCKVRGGLFDARFSRNAYQLLVHHIHHDEKDKRFFLSLNKNKYYLTTN